VADGLYQGGPCETDREADDLSRLLRKAPKFNPNAALITGTVCGIRVENIDDPLMQKIRYLDKLIDELAKGKPMEKILRKS
jgi:hypothetical protein